MLHFAAQSSMRQSAEDPTEFARDNAECFTALLSTVAKYHRPQASTAKTDNSTWSVKVIYASSASVYNDKQRGSKMPFSVKFDRNKPHSEGSLFELISATGSRWIARDTCTVRPSATTRSLRPCSTSGMGSQWSVTPCFALLAIVVQIGLRLFTVYGPWGRPDMAVYKFAER